MNGTLQWTTIKVSVHVNNNVYLLWYVISNYYKARSYMQQWNKVITKNTVVLDAKPHRDLNEHRVNCEHACILESVGQDCHLIVWTRTIAFAKFDIIFQWKMKSITSEEKDELETIANCFRMNQNGIKVHEPVALGKSGSP